MAFLLFLFLQFDSPLYMPLFYARTDGCMLNDEERTLERLLLTYPGQQRDTMRCHPLLARAARYRAEDMRDRLYLAHCSPDGECVNGLVVRLGYPLPYNPDENNIESLAAGYRTPEAAFAALLNSPAHRLHVLGSDPFFEEQQCYGVGYARRAGGQIPGRINFERWYVILTAPCEENGSHTVLGQNSLGTLGLPPQPYSVGTH